MPMRQLRNCDFCGGDAAGVYETIPAELSPTEAEQRRVVLCENCLGTLETVVDPLLSRLGVDRDEGSASTAEPTQTAESTQAEEATPTPEQAATAAEPSSAAESSSAAEPSSAAESSSAAEPSSPAEPSTTESSDTTSPSDGEPSRAADTSSDAEPSPSDSPSPSSPPNQFGAPEGFTDIAEYDGFEVPEEVEDPPEAEQNGRSDARPDRAEDFGRDRAAPESPPTRGAASGTGRDAAGEEPEDFRTVMRLLGNREFPVERDEIAEIAGSAYQLDDAHVDRILDHAVDRGVLADDDGTLRKS